MGGFTAEDAEDAEDAERRNPKNGIFITIILNHNYNI